MLICSLLLNRNLGVSIHFCPKEMQWNCMTVLCNGMSFVGVSCRSISSYDLIIRIELSFGCGKETMVSLNLNLLSMITG